MKDIREIIAKNLITLRKKHGFTQNELAKKLDYSDNPEQFRDVHFAKEEKRLRYAYLRAELLKRIEN